MTSASTKLRAVVGTNLFVSGLILKSGKPFDLLEAWRRGQFALLLSDRQRAELEAVIQRPEIKRKYSVSEDDVVGLFRLLDIAVVRVTGGHQLPVKVRDPHIISMPVRLTLS